MRVVALPVAAALVIAGTSLAAPTPAGAATAPAAAAIAASMRAGTVMDDITAGRISVDQLADAAVAARSGGGAASTPPPDRSEVVREVTAEVEELRHPGELAAPAEEIDMDVDPQGHVTASVDALRTSASWKSFWRKAKRAVTHLATVHLTSLTVRILVGASYATAAALFCALPGVNTVTCGLFYAVVGVLMTLFTTGYPCGDRGFDLEIPDLADSRCGR
jgi:hypothetical protein